MPPSAPPPRSLFESFFAPATPSLNFNWFDHVRTALVDADSRVAALLASGCPERLLLPQRLASYAVRGDCSLGLAVPVNESLLSNFERPLRSNLQRGLPFVMLWLSKHLAVRNWRLSPILCGSSRGC